MAPTPEKKAPEDPKIIQLKRKRAGKKGSITKRIENLKRLVSEGGSRTKINFLYEALLKVFSEVSDVCRELEEICADSYDGSWLEEVKIEVDDCTAEVRDYLEARKDDAPSSNESLTASWVEEHSPFPDGEPVSSGMELLHDQLEKMSFGNGTTLPPQCNIPMENNATVSDVMSGTHRHTVSDNITGRYMFGESAPPAFSSWRESGAIFSSDSEGMLRMPQTSAFTWSNPYSVFNSRGLGLSDAEQYTWSYGDRRLQTSSSDPFRQVHPMGFGTFSVMQPTSTAQSGLSSAIGNNLGSRYLGRPPVQNKKPDPPKGSSDGHREFRQNLQGYSDPPNDVDSWIDTLDPNQVGSTQVTTSGITSEVTMAWLVQQNLPRAELPTFDGNPSDWVDFITKFRDIVHNQQYLNNTQRSLHLVQQLRGEAKRSVKGHSTDDKGYVLALKRLKFLFGQKTRIAAATIMNVTEGKVISNDDMKGLLEFYYSISDCLVSLKKLNYAADLYSSDTLRQAVRRLPPKMVNKWAEMSVKIKMKGQEPNLIHLEEWLQARILALREAYPKDFKASTPKAAPQSKQNLVGTTMTSNKACPSCGSKKHNLSRCVAYKKLTPEKRFEIVKQSTRCFNCLGDGHKTSKCESKIVCFIPKCEKKHHTTLHEYFEKTVEENTTEERREQHNGMVSGKVKQIYLWIVPVLLHAPSGKKRQTYALLDNGSDGTLIRKDMARKLRLRGTSVKLDLSTVKDNPEMMKVREVSLQVSDRDGKDLIPIESAFVVPKTKFNMPSKPAFHNLDSNGDMFTHLDGVDLDPVSPEQITILIGSNVPEALISTEVRRGKEDQPLAVLTRFGWTLFGGNTGSGRTSVNLTLTCPNKPLTAINTHLENVWTRGSTIKKHINTISVEADQISENVERFWKLEHNPILGPKETAMSKEDETAMTKLEAETVNLGNRYQAPMLWSNPEITLTDNYAMALKRYFFLKRTLKTKPDLHKNFKAVIEGFIRKKYARKMTKEEAKKKPKKTWTLPTHPVMNPNKPNSTRVVMDAKAEYQQTSLNKALVTGPDLLNSLPGVLIRFRTSSIALVADVEEMFLQILVPPDDRDSLRFLWSDSMNEREPPDTYQMLVHIFGAKDSPTIANYILRRTARDNYKDFDALTYEAVVRAFYVDDLLKSLHSEEESIRLAQQLREMLKRGGFRLTKFLSNNKNVMESIPVSERSPKVTFELKVDEVQRALGVAWDTNEDIFTFSFTDKDAPMTKRGILRITCSIFDPLGFLTPFILTAKLVLQELWRSKVDWDEEADETMKKRWKKWLTGGEKVNQVKLNRCYLSESDPICLVQLHVFVDSSEIAYGTVAYLRFTLKSGRHVCSFLTSKSRLAPIATLTLPRLELNAALTGARLFRSTITEIDFPIEKVYFWSDSTLVLQYIRNTTQRFKVYVANRVTEILEVSSPEQWNHVPGHLNPADLLTRGVFDPSDLMQEDKEQTGWFTGPLFLQKSEDEWPKLDVGKLKEDDPEIKRRNFLVGVGILKEYVIDPGRFSSWKKLKTVVAWILRFAWNLKQNESSRILQRTVRSDEMVAAERFLVKDTQSIVFQEEMHILSTGKSLPGNHVMSSLCPFVDSSGFLRVGGRLENANISDDAKHQCILPKDHPITRLLIKNEHVKNGHIGVNHILANLNSSYWILSARFAINYVLRRCFYCKVKKAKSKYPYMANLPSGRVAFEEPPFSHCGVDLLGPIFVKQGRKRLKRWISLFTCLTVRSVHLEVVENAETDSFINALRRFTNRRGAPKKIYSDCGSNFKGASNELKEVISAWDKDKILNAAVELSIEWKFNPPAAPHMGGVWERLVRSVKEVLTGVTLDRVLTDPQLYTFLTDVERILNTRPLTYISTDPDDLQALTPNHILLGKHRNWSQIIDTDEKDITSRKQWRQVQALQIIFWKRWKKEYLPTLTKRACWKDKIPNFKEGQLVLVMDDDSSYKVGKWNLGKIKKVHPAKDGVVRVVEVRTKNGDYTRPVTKLCNLEDDLEDDVPQGEENVHDTS